MASPQRPALSRQTVLWQLEGAISNREEARSQLLLGHQQTGETIRDHFDAAREAMVRDLDERQHELLLQNRNVAGRRCGQLDELILKMVTDRNLVELKLAQDTEGSPVSQEELIEYQSLASVPLPGKIAFEHGSVEQLKDTLAPHLQQARLSFLSHPPHCYVDVPQGGIMCHTSTDVSQEVILCDEEGRRLCCEQKHITAHLMNEISEFVSLTKCDVASNPDGTCAVSFTTPEKEGIYSLYVLISGESIRGSPYRVRVYGANDHLYPTITHAHARYCAVQGNQLIVSAKQSTSLTAYNLSNFNEKEELRDFEFTNPRGIEVTGNVLFVADVYTGLGRVVKMTRESGGTKAECFAEGDLKWPLGLQLDKEGTLYATSMESREIKRYKPSSSGSYTYDSSLNLPYKPYDLAFDADGCLHVAFGDRNEEVKGISVYSKEGVLLREYGKEDISRSGGIAIDKNGFTYATEYFQEGRLVVFNPQEKKVFASSPTSLDWPMGVCVSEDGRVFVACNYGKRGERVVVF